MPYPDPISHLNRESAVPAGPYLDRLDEEDRASFRLIPGTDDLTSEIRLMHAMLARLFADTPQNVRAISSILTVLVRAATLQSKRSNGASDVERALCLAAEKVLEAQGKKGFMP